MKIKKERKFNLPKKIMIFSIVGFFSVSFLTWALIRFLTISSEIGVVNLFEFPATTLIQNEFSDDSKIFSVAIDGNVVAGRDGEIVRPTASTAKMILGLSIMDKKPFNPGEQGETITITQEFYDRYIYYLYNNGSNTAVRVGEEISVYDALMSVFLASSNNMADSLAIWAFGSLDNYREYAADYLNRLGIHDTTIGEDASGFSDTTTSTANDLARIGNLVLENPILSEIVKTSSFDVPVVGTIHNTNRLLGVNRIVGIKTGFIGDNSGYCLVSGYKEKDHNITVTLLGAETRTRSFDESLALVQKMQDLIKPVSLIRKSQVVGYYDSWWTGTVPIYAEENLDEIIYSESEKSSEIIMNGENSELSITIGKNNYRVGVRAEEFKSEPTFFEKIKRVFGWEREKQEIKFGFEEKTTNNEKPSENESTVEGENNPEAKEEIVGEIEGDSNIDVVDESFTNAPSGNCTIKYGRLMLINPNFTVDNNFIATRRGEMVSLSSRYGIPEYNVYNGDNLLDAEAAVYLNDLVKAYGAEHPGHTLGTLSCFRSTSPGCGRMCAATGTSDHHTGLTCDLIDSSYGTGLGTDNNYLHPEWAWLHENSYKYGFIDRFPPEWAGGSMDEPLNVDGNGTTGLYETWHFRYVGIPAATEIATGVYNNGSYDSLEHYLKARGLVSDLKNGRCE